MARPNRRRKRADKGNFEMKIYDKFIKADTPFEIHQLVLSIVEEILRGLNYKVSDIEWMGIDITIDKILMRGQQ